MSKYHLTGKRYYESHKEEYASRNKANRERFNKQRKVLKEERAAGISPNGSLLNNKYLFFPPYPETWGLVQDD